KMDYLYDKVDFYDSLKAVMQGHGDAANLARVQAQIADIEPHMLHFLENHDEQRIASPDFAGDMHKGKPALVVSALISRSPTMIYFGQEVGEDGSEETGFGDPTRTTIFDYAGVPAHQRWMNDGQFDGGQLSAPEKALREYHVNVLNISANHPAMKGNYIPLHHANLKESGYGKLHFSFARYADLGVNEQGEQQHVALLVVNNFDAQQSLQSNLSVPHDVLHQWDLPAGDYLMKDLLNSGVGALRVTNEGGVEVVDDTIHARFSVNLAPLDSAVFEITWSTPIAQ
ncbi:MAG: alpha-amylase family glycosyl hydrolase, partial [Glaciecola sp.]|nr:alpha-amylase family glycosyl hydrolase [Glaciecola sp.]